ncbi:MAG: flagellar biosynthesis protein FlhF [Acetatifactor sp.]|jgi:flagellar biosynthesis protein FlhF|uniref:flagellar biosynthesis protein FlhF n=1 Tax=Acetatifactor sp. TaxID=1872090 RepID=UPI000EDD702A|nr:flagellar biosynthesis protein FlhF [Acetatifactor sp.]HAD53815.1 flagellar biosynthesis protein FlhF [Lachnospiraceae bacterium]
MIIKKFTGKTEAEATEAAKKELGSTLVIMNVREVKKKGLFAFLLPKQIEVTAALEEEAPARPQYGSILRTAADKEIRTEQQNLLAKNSTENIEKKLDSLQTLLESQLNNRQSEKEESAKTQDVPDAEEKEDKTQDMAAAEKKEEEKNPEQDKFIRLLYNKMLDNEMDEKYVNSILEDASKTKKADLPFDYLLANIYQKMVLKFGRSEGITPSEEGPRIVLFIGPTGVGKTTTIAKLAGRYCVEEKKKVALLTADTYRIAAAEQLRTYANILETPFRIIYTPEELQAAVEDYWDCDYIFIDTAGRSHQNTDQLEKMKEMVAALKRPESYQVFLVLSATTKYRDLQKIADCYGKIADFELIFTKLDETEAVGNLLNMKLYTDAPIAYVTCGQNVPDDMEAFNPQKTVKQILGGKE